LRPSRPSRPSGDDRRRPPPGRRPRYNDDRYNRGRAPSRSAEPAYRDLLRDLQERTSIDPFERIQLETTPDIHTTRAMELVAPIGKGQRCLIVSPPKAGKTTILADVARAVEQNHPEILVMVLLVDERPEEVTAFRRGVKSEVMAASSDLSAQDHVDLAERCLAKALVPVLQGKDVMILLDSITRLARAYNTVSEGVGRTMSGGLDAATMHSPRQIFGAARKIEEGGSLTILGTALVETGSRMDEVIFQEFKGTGNTEIVLSRALFEKRIFPCIDISQSGTRKIEKLFDPETMKQLNTLQRALSGMEKSLAMRKLLDLLERWPTNAAALAAIGAALAPERAGS